MRTCPKCKKTIENDLALFCRYCGTKLPEVPKQEEKPEETSAPVSADPTSAPSPVEEPKPKAVPPPLPPLPNVAGPGIEVGKANVGSGSDDEVTIIYTPSDTPPPIPNFSPDPSPMGERGNDSQVKQEVKKAPIPPYRKEKKGGSSVVIFAVVFVLLIILGIIAYGLYYNGVFGSRTNASYEPDYETAIDSVAVDSEYVDNDNYYGRDNIVDRGEAESSTPVENYDNVDNVIERIGTDDEYIDDGYDNITDEY